MKIILSESSTYVSIKDAAHYLRVSPDTLRRWEVKGVLVPERTTGNQRRYLLSTLQDFRKNKKKYLVHAYTPLITHLEIPLSPLPHEDTVTQISQQTEFSQPNDSEIAAPPGPTASPTSENEDEDLEAFSDELASRSNRNSIRKFLFISTGGITGIVLMLGVFSLFYSSSSKKNSLATQQGSAVLADSTSHKQSKLTVNIPGLFKHDVQFLEAIDVKGSLSVQSDAVFHAGLSTDNHDVNLGTGRITASNVIYSLRSGEGVTITGGQRPIISVKDNTSSLGIFKTVKVGSDTVSAGSNTDTLELAAGSGVSLSLDTTNKKVTISSPANAASGFTDDGSTVRLTDSTDNVGIGTSNPSQKLSVSGNVSISGNLLLGGDTIADLSGNGLQVSANTLSLVLPTSGTSSNTTSNSGLELSSSGISLLRGCSNGELLKWNGTDWVCGTDNGGSGTTISVKSNNTLVSSSVDTMNFSTDFSVSESPAGQANVALASNSVTINTSGGISGGGAVALGGTLNLVGSTGVTTAAGTAGQVLVNGGTAAASGAITLSLPQSIATTSTPNFNGLQTGGTSRIDSSGNLSSIGTISSTYLSTSANVVNLAASTDLQFNGTTVISSARNLSNIAGVATDLTPTVTDMDNLGDATHEYNTIYGKTLYQNGNQVCDTTGNCAGLTTTYWNQSVGTLQAKNSTLDLLLGGTATSSAKFAVLNLNSGTPTASISAQDGTGNAIYLTANGSLATTNKQTLTLGSTDSGNVAVFGLGSGIVKSTNGVLGLAVSGTDYEVPLTFSTGLNRIGNTITNTDTGSAQNIFKDIANSGGTTQFSASSNSDSIRFAGSGATSVSFNAGTHTVTFSSTDTNSGGTVTSVGAGNGISTGVSAITSTGTVSLGDLTSEWSQTGAFDIFLNNTTSRLRMLGADGTFTARVDVASLTTSNKTYTLPDFTGASATICLTTGNCAGSGAGVTASGGNSGYISKFSAAQALTDSGLFEDGSGNIGLGTTTPLSKLDVNGAASVSGNLTFSSAASIQTSAQTTLTLGGSNTGNIVVSPIGGAGALSLSVDSLSINGNTGTDYPNDGRGAACVFTTNGIVTGTGACQPGNEPINMIAGTLQEANTTLDLLLGGTATTSAKFGFLNVNPGSGTPTASISGSTANAAVYLTGDGVLATMNKGSLTLGNSDTGNITLANNTTFGGNLTLNSDTISDFTGNGLQVSSNALTLKLDTNPGLQNGASGLSLIRTCSDNNLLKYTSAGGWACATDIGSGSGGAAIFTEASSTVYPTAIADRFGIGTTTSSDIASALYITHDLASGATGKALAVFNQTESQDLLTASASGTTKFAVSNNGSLIFAGGSGFLQTLTSNAAAAKTYNLPTFTGTSTDICLATGNCAGAGAGVTASGGNAGYLAKFSAAQAITSSVLYDDGSNIGIGTTTPLSKLDVNGSASVSGNLTFSSAASIQTSAQTTLTLGGSNTGNIVVSPIGGSGALSLNVGALSVNGTAGVTISSAGQCVTTTNGIVTGTGACQPGNEPINEVVGTLQEANTTLDFLLGGTATSSAKFGFLNINPGSGTPTASISAQDANGNAIFLTADGNLATANKTSLTLGGGDTGNIILGGFGAGVLQTNASGVISTGTVSVANGGTGATSLTGNAVLIGNGTSSIGTVGPGSDGQIFVGNTSGAPTFVTLGGDATLNSGTGVLTIASDAVALGTDTTGNYVATITSGDGLTGTGSSEGSTPTLAINTTDIVGCTSTTTSKVIWDSTNKRFVCATDQGSGSGGSKFSQNGGVLYPNEATVDDLLLGGTATSSAKFAFVNVNSGTPTASISAVASNNALSFDALGNISTANRQSLVLGNSSTSNTTGNVLINPNGTGKVGIGTTAPGSLLTINDPSGNGGTLLSLSTTNSGVNGANLQITADTRTLEFGSNSNIGPHVGSTTTGGLMFLDTNAVAPMVGLSATTNAVDLGNSSYKFRDEYLSGQLNSATISTSGQATFGTTKKFLITPDYGGMGELPAGVLVGSNTNDSLSIVADDATPIAGTKLILGYNSGGGSTYRSALEVANVSSGYSNLILMKSGGSVGLGTTTPLATLDVNGAASVSGNLTLAGAYALQTQANSALTIGGSSTGNITLSPLNSIAGASIAPGADNTVDLGLSGTAFKTGYFGTDVKVGGVSVCLQNGTNCQAGAATYWAEGNGAIYPVGPYTGVADLLLGSTATSSAKFGFLNVNSGTPTASISGSIANANLYINGDGLLATTSNQSLILGASGTGNVILAPGGTSALTARGANITLAGNLTLSNSAGTTSFGGLTYTWPTGAIGGNGYILSTTSGGALSWIDPGTLPTSDKWDFSAGVYSPKYASVGDFALGGTATASAKFAVLNMNSGTPTASISANSGNNALFVDGAGNISTSNRQSLVLGNSSTYNSTGNILLNPNGTGKVGIGTTTPTSTLYINGGSTQSVLSLDGTNNPKMTFTDTFHGGAFDILFDQPNGALSFLSSGTTSRLYLKGDGTVGIGTTTPNSELYVTRSLSSGATGKALAIFDQLENQDILTASASGVTRLALSNNGTLNLYGATSGIVGLNVGGTTASYTMTLPTAGPSNGYLLTSDNTGQLTWTDPGSLPSSNYWDQYTGGSLLAPKYASVADLVLGGTSSTSAKFAFLNVNSGTPTASISANSGNNATYLTGAGVLGTSNSQTLTLGGTSTGNIVLSPLNNQSGARVTPGADNIVSLGASSSARFKDLYLGNSSLHLQCLTTDGCGQNLDYGMSVNSGGTLNLGANGTNTLSLAQGGNIGIGTTAPSAKLYVSNNDSTIAPLKVDTQLSTVYQKPITVDNTSNGSALTDYQVSVTVDTATLITAGKMRSDCGDMRFTDSDQTTQLNYWIEGTCNTSSTKVWVKVPSIPASSSKTIYLQYGNLANTSQSSDTNTFVRVNSSLNAGWKFDEGTGTTANDSSGNSNTATLVNSPAWTTGKFGDGIYVNGSSQNLNAGANASINSISSAITVSAWAYPEANSSYAYITSNDRDCCGAYKGYALFISNGTPTFRIWDSTGTAHTVDAGATVSLSTWHHIVGTFDGTTLSIYVDGSFKNSVAYTGSIGTPASYNFRIGALGFDQSFNGNLIIDELRVFSTALSSSAVTDEYNNYGYVTTADSNKELIRKYSSPEPSTSIGSEGSAASQLGTAFMIQNGSGFLGVGTTNPDTFKLQVAGNVGPDLDGTYNLGSASKNWNNLYVKNIYISGNTAGFFQRNNGVLAPANISDDLTIGGIATTSAKFQIFGNTGNASSSGTLTLSSASNAIQSTAMQTLTLGGSTTGNITLSPNNSSGGLVTVNGNLKLSGSSPSLTLSPTGGTSSTLTLAGASPYLNMTGTTSNVIYYGTNGVAAPGASSTGEKIQLYGTAGSVGSTDYALGIESSHMWFNSGGGFKWYESSAQSMILDTSGNLSIGATSGTSRLTVNTPGTADSLASAIITSTASTNKGLVVQGATSQTNNLQEWQTSTGNLIASVNPTTLIVYDLTASPNYTNTDGTGDRRSTITVSTTIAGGTISNIIDGLDGNCFGLNGYQTLNGLYVEFDFGTPKVITEVTSVNNRPLGGTWQWQGSNDNSSWTNIGGQTSFPTASTEVDTAMSANSIAYRYYRILSVSAGTDGASESFCEMKFKIADASSSGNTYATGGYLGIGTGTLTHKLNVSGSVEGKALAMFNETGDQALFTASASGTTKFTLSNAGNLQSVAGANWQPLTNATNALNIANAAGSPFVTFDSSNKRLGIGVTNPQAALHVADTQAATVSALIENTNTGTDADGLAIKLGFTGTGTQPTAVNSYVGNRFVTFLDGNGEVQGAIESTGANGVNFKTTGADMAEYFTKADAVEQFSPGDLVCYQGRGVSKCSASTGGLVGVVSAHPGFTGGEDGPDKVLVALVGQVPVSVSTENGAIASGDPLMASVTTPGTAVKATKAGQVIGYAHSAAPSAGQIMATVAVSWYDPDVYLSSTGDVVSKADGSYAVIAPDGTLSSRVGSYNALAAGSMTVGSMNAKSVTTDQLKVGGKSLDQYIQDMLGSTATESAVLSASSSASLSALSTQMDSLTQRVQTLEQQASASAMYNQLASAPLISTGSASLQSLSVDQIDMKTATVSGDLSVLGRTVVKDLGVTGTITSGITSINGLDGTLNVLGTLKLQSNGFGDVDILAGKVTIANNGDITTVGEITAKKINIETADTLNASAGEATITAGQSAITIPTSAVTTDSLIQVTFSDDYSPATRYWISKKYAGKSFTVQLDSRVRSNATFSWWIVN